MTTCQGSDLPARCPCPPPASPSVWPNPPGSKENQTPETPNVLGIYVFSKVLKDMMNIGIDNIVRDTNYKSSLLYNTINNHSNLYSFIKNKEIQSKTVIVANCKNESDIYINAMKEKGFIIGKGYGSGNKLIRIANFPTHSKEVFWASKVIDLRPGSMLKRSFVNSPIQRTS